MWTVRPLLSRVVSQEALRVPVGLSCCGNPARSYADEISSFNDAVDGCVGDLNMIPGNSADKYPSFGQVERDAFVQAVLAAENSSGISQPPLVYGQSQKTWMEREIFMWQEGCKRLARIMDRNPDAFSALDVKNSLSYLLPSQVWNADCRPRMVDPRIVFRASDVEDKDLWSFPESSSFYTGSSDYQDILYNIFTKAEEMTRKQESAGFRELMEEFNRRSGETFVWLGKKDLERKKKILLSTEQYGDIIRRLDLLAAHKLSFVIVKFLREFSQSADKAKAFELKERNQEGRRKHVRVFVKLRHGTGKFFIRERSDIRAGLSHAKDLSTYFPRLMNRQSVLHPFVLTNSVGLFDADVEVVRPGPTDCGSAVAGAIRVAASRALVVMNSAYEKVLDDAKLLVYDGRRRERKKAGRWGARRTMQWSKR